jgi:hypothetical protein
MEGYGYKLRRYTRRRAPKKMIGGNWFGDAWDSFKSGAKKYKYISRAAQALAPLWAPFEGIAVAADLAGYGRRRRVRRTKKTGGAKKKAPKRRTIGGMRKRSNIFAQAYAR